MTLKRIRTRVGIGQDSHRFLHPTAKKPLVLGGLLFEETPGFMANSDGDVVLHALCNAITSLTGTLILGGIADKLCLEMGISDSAIYLKEALNSLGPKKLSMPPFRLNVNVPKSKTD